MGGDAEHSLIKPHQPLISSPRRRNFFPVGSVVEVRTDEEDFRGVFFSATVLPSPSTPKKSRRKNSRKLFVEYHNLLSHEDGSDHLREYVDVKFVRPEPPLKEIVKGFEPDDVVDAFNRDGWWTGVVTTVLEGGERYIVTFQYPPDVLELGLPELRVHWDWVNGSWVRPQKKSMAGLMFDVGQKVEVSFDREELRDAWFPATIQEDLGNGTFSVEYRIADTDNESKDVKATVDSLHLRPCPPLLKAKSFVLLEKVDAFFDFCWWNGVITKVLENSGYLVFFKQRSEDKTFNLSELRPHMEWKDGKWFTSSQLSQEASILSSDGVHEHHTPESSRTSGETVPVDSSIDRKDTCDGKTTSSLALRKGYLRQLTPDYQKMSHGTSLRKRRQHLSDSGTALSQPLKKLKEGDTVGANQQDRHDVLVNGVLCDFLSPDLVNNMETSAMETTVDQSSSDPSWGKRIRRQPRSVGPTQSIRGMIKSTLSSMEKSCTQVSPLERMELVTGGKPPDAAVNVDEDCQNGHAKGETEIPIIIGLPCEETGNSKFGRSGGRRNHRSNGNEMAKQKQQLENPTAQKVKESEQSTIGELSDRKKRGRPKKTQVESTQTPVAGDLSREDIGSHAIPEVVTARMEASISNQEKMVVDKKLADGLSEPKTRKVRMLARVPEEKGVKESVRPGQNRPLRRGKRSTGEKIAVQPQDLLGASGGKMMEDNHMVEVERVIGVVPGNEFDDEPLSKWIEMQSTPVIDGTGLFSVDTMEQCLTNGGERRDGVVLDEETGRQTSALVDQGSIVSSEPQSVPSIENTVGVVLAEDSQKQPESGTPAFASVDKGSVVPSEPQNLPSVENTAGVVLDEASKKQPESETRAPAFVNEGSLVLCEPPTLPFVKNTILWRTIESMEVFQRMPQKPHFQPLENLKESSREGLAIGYMVTFSSLVEKASKLQLNVPKSIMVDIVESLAELEKHGFDVRGVQDRVTELLAVKESEENLVDKLNDFNNQISEHSHEKAKIEQEIQHTSLAIKQLQQKLSLDESAKDREEDEIAALHDRLKETEEIIKNVRCDFDAIVSNILS